MRILSETEMSVAAGGVDPLPRPTPEPMIKPDREDVYWMLQNWSIPEVCDHSSEGSR